MTEGPAPRISITGGIEIQPGGMPAQQDDACFMAECLNNVLSQIRRLEARAAQYKEWLAEHLGDGQHNLPNGARLSVYKSRRFNAEKAREVLPDLLYTACCRAVIQRDLAERVLTPEQFDQCKTETSTTVRLEMSTPDA